MRRLAPALITLLLLAAAAPPAGLAAPAAVVLDDAQVGLTDTAGGRAATVRLTNVTDAPVVVRARSTAAGCALRVDHDGVLAPAARTDLGVTIPAACGTAAPFPFLVLAGEGAATQELRVTAITAPKAAAVDWTPLRAFLYALGAAVAVVLLIYAMWAWGGRAVAGSRSPATPLRGLGASWSFRDSWLSNVTAASGLVVAILGSSDLLKRVLGTKAENAIAVATVAGVIAVALVGAAGVVVLALRRPGASEVSIGGLLTGTAIGLWAAGGQVWAITWLLTDLDLGVDRTVVPALAVVASALLVVYAYTSITGFLVQGTAVKTPADPLKSPVPVEVLAAAITAAGTEHPERVNRAQVEGVLAQLSGETRAPEVAMTAEPAPPPLAMRAAML